MALWAPVIFSTPEGEELQGLGEAFVGRHVIPRYRGYMQSQAERLLGTRSRSGHGRRGGGGREELLAAHGYDTKYAMHCARLGFQGLELLNNRRLNLPIADEPGDRLRAKRRGDVPFDEWWERGSGLTRCSRTSSATTRSPPSATVRSSKPGWSRPISLCGPGNPVGPSASRLRDSRRTGRVHSLDLQVRPI